MSVSSIVQPKDSTKKQNSKASINEVFLKQREFFNTFKTRDIDFRIEQLKRLHRALTTYEEKIAEAMYADLKRSKQLTYFTEVGLSLKSISMAIKNLKKWAKPKKVKATWDLFPLSKTWVQYEPLGQMLIISPWNYPVTLTIDPLTAAISAGNTAILKPSELSANVSQVMAEMIAEFFDEEYITVFQGDKDVVGNLLELPFDHIMYTGGPAVGKIIMEAASKHLTPVTLELGGKSPTIVDKHVDYVKSAKRIMLAKFMNCGQTCIAPDHLFVHADIADQFIEELKKQIRSFFNEDPSASKDYGRIISRQHFERLRDYLNDGKIVEGGTVKEDELYIAPTLMVDVSMGSKVMQEEIFGPIFPVITYKKLNDVLQHIRSNPKPLALYIYSNDKAIHKKVLAETSSGSIAINDSGAQFFSSYLPFGGVGNSGMGRYHGKYGFESFSHHRAVLKQTNLIDLNLKYPPITDKTVKLLRKILK